MAKSKRQYKGGAIRERGSRVKKDSNKKDSQEGFKQEQTPTMDGYSIPEANIGVPGYNLLSRGGYTAGRLTENQELLTTLYRENWIVKRIIDTPAEDMTKKWYKLNSTLPPKKDVYNYKGEQMIHDRENGIYIYLNE